MRHRLGLVWTALLLGGVSACQTLSLDRSSTPLSTGNETTTSDTASANIPFSNYDLEDACNGVPVTRAAVYDKELAGIHPIAVFHREGANESYIHGSSRVPEAWEVSWEEAEKTELVVCLTATQRELANECVFDENDDGSVYTLEVYHTVYDASLYVAQTGELLESTQLDVKASSDCPMFHMFTEGEPVDQSDARFDQAVLDFAKPYVQITASSAESSS